MSSTTTRTTRDNPVVPEQMGANGLGSQNGFIGGGWGDEVRSAPNESSWAVQAGGPPASKRNS